MTSFDSYEQNLEQRLAELRAGDRAYDLHARAIFETLPYIASDAEDFDHMRILDVGCGLGFVAKKLASWPDSEVVGIDPSAKAIRLAKKEHAGTPNLSFYTASAQEFAKKMPKLGESLFDRAILNMVLHSVDDTEAINILTGIKDCLVPHGSLTLIVPDELWLMQKIIEKGHKAGMSQQELDVWGKELFCQPTVDLAVGIHGEREYEHPITIYNRLFGQYGELLLAAGYGVDLRVSTPDGGEESRVFTSAYWELRDHLNGFDLATHDRHVLLTQVK